MMDKIIYERDRNYLLHFIENGEKIDQKIVGAGGYGQEIIEAYASGCKNRDEVVDQILGWLGVDWSRVTLTEKEVKRSIRRSEKTLVKKGILDYVTRKPVARLEPKESLNGSKRTY